jgi:hypothetical protein
MRLVRISLLSPHRSNNQSIRSNDERSSTPLEIHLR